MVLKDSTIYELSRSGWDPADIVVADETVGELFARHGNAVVRGGPVDGDIFVEEVSV